MVRSILYVILYLCYCLEGVLVFVGIYSFLFVFRV